MAGSKVMNDMRTSLYGRVDYRANWMDLKEKLRSLTRDGVECSPIMTIYNTGAHLFMVAYDYRDTKSPLSHFNAATPWQWMRQSRWSSDCVKKDSDRVVWFVSIDTHGHSRGIAGLTLKANDSEFVCTIPRGGMIHVVDTYNSDIRIITEVRPLPIWIFDSIRSRETQPGVFI